METEVLYRIHWLAIRTGKTGYGSRAFPKAQAELSCEKLNMANAGLLLHWIAPDTEGTPVPQEVNVEA